MEIKAFLSGQRQVFYGQNIAKVSFSVDLACCSNSRCSNRVNCNARTTSTCTNSSGVKPDLGLDQDQQ